MMFGEKRKLKKEARVAITATRRRDRVVSNNPAHVDSHHEPKWKARLQYFIDVIEPMAHIPNIEGTIHLRISCSAPFSLPTRYVLYFESYGRHHTRKEQQRKVN